MMSIVFSVFSKPWKELRLGELAERIAQLGFAGVELPVRPGFQVEPHNVRERLKELVRVFTDHGLRVHSVASEPTPEVLAACAESGVPLIRIMAHVTPDQPYMAQLDEWQQRLSAYARLCQQYGVRVGVQPHYGDCVADVMSLLRLLEPFDPRWIGAVWDAAHDGLTGVHPEFTLDAVWDRLFMVNLKNAFYVNENGPEADSPAWHRYFTDGRHGLASWPRIATYLQRRGYDGVVCLTAEYDRKHEVDRLAALDLEYARSLFSEQGR
jgi:sugar phosphate isomerase/epimerase